MLGRRCPGTPHRRSVATGSRRLLCTKAQAVWFLWNASLNPARIPSGQNPHLNWGCRQQLYPIYCARCLSQKLSDHCAAGLHCFGNQTRQSGSYRSNAKGAEGRHTSFNENSVLSSAQAFKAESIQVIPRVLRPSRPVGALKARYVSR
jgi:hypothetical protein